MSEEKTLPADTEQASNYLDMSDDDISNLSPEQAEQAMASQGEEPNEEDTQPAEEESEEPSEQEEPEQEVVESPDDARRRVEEGEEPEAEEDEEEPEPLAAKGKKAKPQVSEGDEAGDEGDDKAADTVDYKSQYEAVMAPFKANGKMMEVNSVEDVRRLMQMGANYSKKIAALKPNLKLIKTLEKNDLLSEERVNFLIDLSKKKPEAIAKYLKDAEVDPMDLNLAEDTDYKPETHTVSDQQMALEEVLDEIRDSEHFDRTIDELGNKWDARSRQVLSENPYLIRVINEHMSDGIYDQVMGIVERERLVGRLEGLSDIEAYKQVGDAIAAKGGFTKSEPKPKESKPKQDPRTRSRKRAASPTKGTPSKKAPVVNPLSMSDEEFEKSMGSQYF